MSKVVLDPELQAKFNGMNQPFEVCDETGRTLGHYLPAAVYQKLLYAAVKAACPFSAEELERRRQETGGRVLADFWKELGVS